MFKFLIVIVLVLTTIIFAPSLPAYAQGARSLTLVVSATLPEHVMDNTIIGISPLLSNASQIVQTQTVIRNNKSITITSIVLP